MIKAGLPVLKKEDVPVELDHGCRVIRGESKTETPVANYVFVQIHHRAFQLVGLCWARRKAPRWCRATQEVVTRRQKRLLVNQLPARLHGAALNSRGKVAMLSQKSSIDSTTSMNCCRSIGLVM